MKKLVITLIATMALFCMSSVAFATDSVDGEQQDRGTIGATDAMLAKGEVDPGFDLNTYAFELSSTSIFEGDDSPFVICEELEEGDAYNVIYDEVVWDTDYSGTGTVRVVAIYPYEGELEFSYYVYKTSISLNKTSTPLYRNGTFQIKPTVINENGATTYSSSNTGVATVSSSGKITAKAKGTATITVKNGYAKKTVKVTVKNPTLNITSTSLYVKGTKNLKITGKVGSPSFVSSNKTIATVNKSGKIVAKKKGTCTVTVKTNGLSLKCKVTVKNPKLNLTKTSVFVKGKKTLKVTGKIGKATFKSSNKKIAVVNKAGKITAKKKGTCTITVKSNGVTLKCKVTVKNPYLNKKKVTIIKNRSAQLKITGKIGKATFKSSNKKVAVVSAKGVIKAKKKGKCTITVKSNGVTLKCKVTVKNPPPVYVYTTRTGKRYHRDYDCWGLSNANAIYTTTLQKAKNRGLTPCHICGY